MTIVRFKSSYMEPYPLQVVVESSYREEIEEVTGYTGEDYGVEADDFIAHLILDDNNIYDRGNAVAVEINGKTVGHLSTSAAKKYRKKLKELGLSDVVGECFASIKGGFALQSGGMADFGVRLDLAIDEMQIYTAPAPEPSQPKQATVTPPQQPAIQQPVQPKQKTNRNLNLIVGAAIALIIIIALASLLR